MDHRGVKNIDDQIDATVRQVGRMIVLAAAVVAFAVGFPLINLLVFRLTGFGLPHNLVTVAGFVLSFRVLAWCFGWKWK